MQPRGDGVSIVAYRGSDLMLQNEGLEDDCAAHSWRHVNDLIRQVESQVSTLLFIIAQLLIHIGDDSQNALIALTIIQILLYCIPVSQIMCWSLPLRTRIQS